MWLFGKPTENDLANLPLSLPKWLRWLRIAFSISIILLALMAALFSGMSAYGIGFVRWVEALCWLFIGLTASLILYRDPAWVMKGISGLCLFLFCVEYLSQV